MTKEEKVIQWWINFLKFTSNKRILSEVCSYTLSKKIIWYFYSSSIVLATIKTKITKK